VGQDGDDIIALPNPPPPRPAARGQAIDAALRKFDGIEETPARQRPSQPWWATMHRRPAGAFAAVAIVALIALPVLQTSLRDQAPVPAREEAAAPDIAQPNQDAAAPPEPAPAAQPPGPAEPSTAAPPPPAEPAPQPQTMADSFAPVMQEVDRPAAERGAPAPAMMAPPSAPPPPPPPPPPASPRAEKASEDSNIVVTGSRIRRSNLESAAPVTVVGSDAKTDRYAETLSRLQSSLRANDRRAVIRLIGFPLTVRFGAENRIYRSARDVERDFDRIFTAEVRASVLSLSPHTLANRDNGQRMGNRQIRLGPSCAARTCPDDSPIKLREIAARR